MFDMKKYKKEYYQKNKEKMLANHKKWRENNPEYTKKYNEKYRKEHRPYHQKWVNEHREHVKSYNNKRRKQFRIDILNIISGGNPHCVRCGCDDIRLLEINHKNGGGGKEMHGGKLAEKFYKDIHKGERKTDDLELLCRICNAHHYLELKYGKLPYKISYDIYL